MDIYTATIEVVDARAASLPLGGRRYDYSMYQDADTMWRRVTDPGYVAALRGYVMVAVESHDERDMRRRIGREIAIPLDEPPTCAPGGLHVDLRDRWRILAVDTCTDERYAYASARPRIWASRLYLGSLVPIPPAARNGDPDKR